MSEEFPSLWYVNKVNMNIAPQRRKLRLTTEVRGDNLAHTVTRTLNLLRLHLNAIITYQKLYGRVVTCPGNSPLCGIKLPGNTPLSCVYIKGQNELCVNRTLTAVVGGRVREDSDIRFGRHLCS